MINMGNKKEELLSFPKAQQIQENIEVKNETKKMYQGTATNKLATINTKKIIVDSITGNATIEDNGIKILLENHKNLKAGLRISTQKLLDISIVYLTANNHYKEADINKVNTDVSIPLKEYARHLGCDVTLRINKKSSEEEIEKEKSRVKNLIGKIRTKVKEDLETLDKMILSWVEPKKGKKGSDLDYENIRILQKHGIKNGVINLRFTQDIAFYLNNSYLTNYPTKLLTLDERNPLSYQLGRKLSLHNNIENNIKNRTQNIISIKTLLKNIGSLRTLEEINEKDPGHWEERIKNPLENALNILQDKEILKYWEYSNTKGTPLRDEQIEISNYKTFEELYIHFEINK